MQADSAGFRFLVLFFNCMLTFGSYFCFDMPSVLQGQFQNATCDPHNSTSNQSQHNQSCCDDCLGMSPDDYNLLYAIYAWTNAVIVIGAGFFIDKLGNRIGVLIFSFLCVLGSSTFAAGAFFKGSKGMLPLMLIGRLLFGSGNGSLTIVQNRITAFWFKDKELAMAFGITLAFSRLGSVLNFLVTPNFATSYGLLWTLWGGAILCGLGFISAIVVGLLDKFGLKQLGMDGAMESESRQLKVSDVKHLSLLYWLLILTIMFFYNGVFPFVADASKFIQDKYHYDSKTSAYMAGAVYDISMVLSPFLGFIIDRIGMRGYLASGCALLTIPVFGLLAFSNVHPLVSTLWLGVTYSFAASSMWPTIPLVVSANVVGTAFGLCTSLQMIGIGISNLIVGQILGGKDLPAEESVGRWRFVMIFLLANTLACVAVSTILNIIDKRRDGVLNQSKKEKLAKEELRQNVEEREPTETDPLLSGGNSIN
ncbi:hypothetical protein CAPTEDRAFT_21878 [Capitella teleta]|uniref:Lysosomal dipeptide transporter MFSD1 n=1 Tax=Capitella teleta TaxID=283909 RepID=R7UIQ8_CAPTE|nr:hypothetical protein CAPTEDRAFT_21878 [Capitella teleta]|eukprot:ELU06449.1 hypothetical protein CAPTEDRAFT_21878 [Capitella teleta]